ncbi:MAG: carboxypeptidase regulatory-like domain-containing protein [Leptolyngbyaceae cyanobacterium SL_7_1]|nr:carboxypeptidase regulatory-like domain-containing protein [Leptolyngbyaceae cyanobacterium SL_7_1]
MIISLSLLSLVGAGEGHRAWAHGVQIEYQATQAYEIQAAYDTGTPMADAQVAVYSPDEPSEPWLTGTTDAQGRFVFSPTTPGNWEVQIRQAGHGDILVIPVGDGGAGSASGSSNSYTPLQTGLMIGSVLWGCIGTALFFSRSIKR